jgi:hypothetical protein
VAIAAHDPMGPPRETSGTLPSTRYPTGLVDANARARWGRLLRVTASERDVARAYCSSSSSYSSCSSSSGATWS